MLIYDSAGKLCHELKQSKFSSDDHNQKVHNHNTRSAKDHGLFIAQNTLEVFHTWVKISGIK